MPRKARRNQPPTRSTSTLQFSQCRNRESIAESATFNRLVAEMWGFLDGSEVAASRGVLENPAGLNWLTEKIIGCAIAVHRAFGPGLLESIYHACLVIELGYANLQFERERRIPLIYRDAAVGSIFKLDLIVEGQVIVEVKAIQDLAPVHTAQMLTYLKLTGCPVGLLINFNVPVLKDGIRRVVNRERSAV